jgi:hypothetical protein
MQKVSEVYKHLYHYTTLEGLYGILKSQCLWGTHYKFLNDYSEIILFRDKLIDFLQPHVLELYKKVAKDSPEINENISNKGGLRTVVEHDTAVFVDGAYRATGEEIYITSFCGEHINSHVNSNGLLSQWRGYGIGGGFALEFETQELERIVDLEAARFSYGTGHTSDVIYSDDDEKFRKELHPQLSDIADHMKQLLLQINSHSDTVPDGRKAFSGFVQCVSRYKHCGFKEENEVRLVALPNVHNDKFLKLAKEEKKETQPEKERKFRNRNGERVPYIEFFDSTDIDLPIKRIIVGPHKDKEARASALRVMLKNTNVAIEVSDIPYIF